MLKKFIIEMNFLQFFMMMKGICRDGKYISFYCLHSFINFEQEKERN